MRAGRIKHQIDRWRKRPRFGNPIPGIALAFLVIAILLLLLGQGSRPAPETAPTAPPPVSFPRTRELPAPTPIEFPKEEPPAPLPEEPAETASGCPEGCDVPPPGCDIKGNISYSTGEKIYHLPGGEFYDRTKIAPGKGEAWFCTEEEARANGWRRSKR
jgi:hypothetical protein